VVAVLVQEEIKTINLSAWLRCGSEHVFSPVRNTSDNSQALAAFIDRKTEIMRRQHQPL
jgi:hypothetical protein